MLSNLAEVQLWRGMWAESTQNAQESLLLSQENLYQIGQGQARLILAQSAFERGLYSEATRHAKEAHRISLDIKIPTLEAKVSFILGKNSTGVRQPQSRSFLFEVGTKDPSRKRSRTIPNSGPLNDGTHIVSALSRTNWTQCYQICNALYI